jgi:hypothetical protein
MKKWAMIFETSDSCEAETEEEATRIFIARLIAELQSAEPGIVVYDDSVPFGSTQ